MASTEEIRILTVARADLPRFVELHRRILPQSPSNFEVGPRVESIEQGLVTRPRQERFFAELGGELVGLARTFVDADTLALGGAYAFIAVDEAVRRRGAGTRLYDEVSGWVESVAAPSLVARLVETADEGLAWAGRRGFVEIARDLRLTLDLARASVPTVEAPVGVELTTLERRPELLRGVYDAYCEAAPDVPGYELIEVESFEEWERGYEVSRAERHTAVATTATEVVAWANLKLRPEGYALNIGTGVKQSWRRRGVARALKATQIVWAKEAGYERLEARNDTRNTAILRLNESLGYTRQSATLILRGPLARRD